VSLDVTSRTTERQADTALAAAARRLLSSAAVRSTAQRVLDLACRGGVAEWSVDLDRLPATADFVARVARERYPRLDPPLHARWRHFVFDGRDLWIESCAQRTWSSAAARARAAFDLAITSVLLDAGAGPRWGYSDSTTGLMATRSEGLALASLRWFVSGGMSDDPGDPLRADTAALQRIDEATLSVAFQVGQDNPLTGLTGRAQLLNRLGAVVHSRPDLFASEDTPRPGGLFDAVVEQVRGGSVPAAAVLELVLHAFGPIWEGRPQLGGIALGDCWLYPALHGPTPADSYVPLHKLSQWLTYSLVEPLQDAGIQVTGLDELTGLAEYRNGGLFVDCGVLTPRDPAAWSRTHAVGEAFVVGWRSMTVALLDRIAPLVRERLGVTARELPLGRMLEAGTWAAGRLIARERRADAGPPFRIASDGTVF
jgi:uncharacterized protein DUF1688